MMEHLAAQAGAPLFQGQSSAGSNLRFQLQNHFLSIGQPANPPLAVPPPRAQAYMVDGGHQRAVSNIQFDPHSRSSTQKMRPGQLLDLAAQGNQPMQAEGEPTVVSVDFDQIPNQNPRAYFQSEIPRMSMIPGAAAMNYDEPVRLDQADHLSVPLGKIPSLSNGKGVDKLLSKIAKGSKEEVVNVEILPDKGCPRQYQKDFLVKVTSKIIPITPGIKVTNWLNDEFSASYKHLRKLKHDEGQKEEIFFFDRFANQFFSLSEGLPVSRLHKWESPQQVCGMSSNQRWFVQVQLRKQPDIAAIEKTRQIFDELKRKVSSYTSEAGGIRSVGEIFKILECFYPKAYESFDEEENFFGDKKIMKLIPRRLKNEQDLQIVKRHLLEFFRLFLSMRKGIKQLEGFSFLVDQVTIESIIVEDRSTGDRYKLKLADIQAQLSDAILHAEYVLDIKLISVHISNNGSFIGLLFEVLIRHDKMNKKLNPLVFTSNVKYMTQAEAEKKKPDFHKGLTQQYSASPAKKWRGGGGHPYTHHKRESSAIKEMLSGVKGFFSSRSDRSEGVDSTPSYYKPQQRIFMNTISPGDDVMRQRSLPAFKERQPKTTLSTFSSFKRKKSVDARSMGPQSEKSTIVRIKPVEVTWSSQISHIESWIENFEIKRDCSVARAQKLDSLERVTEARQALFLEQPDKMKFQVQMASLVRINKSEDEFFLEIGNLGVSSMKLEKQGEEVEQFIPIKKKSSSPSKNGPAASKLRKIKQNEEVTFKSLVSKISYQNDESKLPLDDLLQVRVCPGPNQLHLSFIVLNSSHIFYTRLYFIRYDEMQTGLEVSLVNMVSPSEQPPSDPVTGKAQIIVDDSAWTPDCQFVVLMLRGFSAAAKGKKGKGQDFYPGSFCILPRFGTSFIRVFNPTRVNLSRKFALQGPVMGSMVAGKASSSLIGQTPGQIDDVMQRPQQFVHLITSDSVVVEPSKYPKRWKISVETNSFEEEQIPTQKAVTIHLSNGGEQEFELKMSYSSSGNMSELFSSDSSKLGNAKDLKWNQERQELCHLRFLLTSCHMDPASLLEKMYDTVQKLLPVNQYEKIQDQYDLDTEQFKNEVKAPAAAPASPKSEKVTAFDEKKDGAAAEGEKKSEPRAREAVSAIGALSCTHDKLYKVLNLDLEEYDPIKVVSSFSKVIEIIRWADTSASGGLSPFDLSSREGAVGLNMKQWLLTVTNDCFFFLMKEGQPLLAYMTLKMAERYFSFKNDSSDFFLIHNTGLIENGEEICLQMEINQFLLNSDAAYNSIVQGFKDPVGQIFSQSQIENVAKLPLQAVSDILPFETSKKRSQLQVMISGWKKVVRSSGFENFVKLIHSKGQDEVDQLEQKLHAQQQIGIQPMAQRSLFQTQITLLIFYCMIQFRNYQAASFNILFLVIANFVQQRQIDPSYLVHYDEVLKLLQSSFADREKTNEYVMFLGSTQKMNYIWPALTTGSHGLIHSFNILRLFLQRNLETREKRRISFNNPAAMLMTTTMEGFKQHQEVMGSSGLQQPDAGNEAGCRHKLTSPCEHLWEEMLRQAYTELAPRADEWPEIEAGAQAEDEEQMKPSKAQELAQLSNKAVQAERPVSILQAMIGSKRQAQEAILALTSTSKEDEDLSGAVRDRLQKIELFIQEREPDFDQVRSMATVSIEFGPTIDRLMLHLLENSQAEEEEKPANDDDAPSKSTLINIFFHNYSITRRRPKGEAAAPAQEKGLATRDELYRFQENLNETSVLRRQLVKSLLQAFEAVSRELRRGKLAPERQDETKPLSFVAVRGALDEFVETITDLAPIAKESGLRSGLQQGMKQIVYKQAATPGSIASFQKKKPTKFLTPLELVVKEEVTKEDMADPQRLADLSRMLLQFHLSTPKPKGKPETWAWLVGEKAEMLLIVREYLLTKQLKLRSNEFSTAYGACQDLLREKFAEVFPKLKNGEEDFFANFATLVQNAVLVPQRDANIGGLHRPNLVQMRKELPIFLKIYDQLEKSVYRKNGKKRRRKAGHHRPTPSLAKELAAQLPIDEFGFLTQPGDIEYMYQVIKTEFWAYQTEQCLLDAQTAKVEAELEELLSLALEEAAALMKKNDLKRLFFLLEQMPTGIKELVLHRTQRQALLDVHLILKLALQSGERGSSPDLKSRILDHLKGPTLSQITEADPILKKVLADLGIQDEDHLPHLFSHLPPKQQVASTKKLLFLLTFLVKSFLTGSRISKDCSPFSELVGLLPDKDQEDAKKEIDFADFQLFQKTATNDIQKLEMFSKQLGLLSRFLKVAHSLQTLQEKLDLGESKAQVASAELLLAKLELAHICQAYSCSIHTDKGYTSPFGEQDLQNAVILKATDDFLRDISKWNILNFEITPNLGGSITLVDEFIQQHSGGHPDQISTFSNFRELAQAYSGQSLETIDLQDLQNAFSRKLRKRAVAIQSEIIKARKFLDEHFVNLHGLANQFGYSFKLMNDGRPATGMVKEGQQEDNRRRIMQALSQTIFKDPRTNLESTIIVDPEVVDYILEQERRWGALQIDSDTEPLELYQTIRERARVSRAYTSLMLPTQELRDEEQKESLQTPVFLPMIQSGFQQMITPFLEDIHIFMTNSLLARVKAVQEKEALLKVRFNPDILKKFATQDEVEQGGLWNDIPWLGGDMSISGEEAESLLVGEGENSESEESYMESTNLVGEPAPLGLEKQTTSENLQGLLNAEQEGGPPLVRLGCPPEERPPPFKLIRIQHPKKEPSPDAKQLYVALPKQSMKPFQMMRIAKKVPVG